MAVTGNAKATIPATRSHVSYVDTLTERFTYYLTMTPSAASAVGVDGWFGYANATYERS